MSFAAGRLGQALTRRVCRSQTAAPALQSRSFAADAHGEVKVNAWEAPSEIGKWKEEHIVFLVLGCWGVGIYSAFKIFGGKKEPKAAAPTPAH